LRQKGLVASATNCGSTLLNKAAARVNNRAENSHQPTRRRKRQMQGFRDWRRTQAFLSRFGPIRQHFALPRHRIKAACHREQLRARLYVWYDWADIQLFGAN
jgi:putative transposase